MTTVVPDTFLAGNLTLWTEAELAKRWVLANLARWGWFTQEDMGEHPRFELLSEQTSDGTANVTMGHDAGLVTINVAEADVATRVARRQALGERYRTMIGHYRHELGHFLFQRLSANDEFITRFRALFGDERVDYAAALEAHYGAPKDGDTSHITSYATSHPHEDWAETFAHLLHLVDITDSFVWAGLSGESLPETDERIYDAYREDDAERLITIAAGLGLALNHVVRSMGISDVYPFVLPPVVRTKMAFAHEWIRAASPAKA